MTKEYDAISLGELVVEFFRKEVDKSFEKPDDLVGPFPSGAPAIFIDTFAKLGGSCGFIGTVGKDDFGRCITNRLKKDHVDISHIIELDDVATGTAFTGYFSDGTRKFIYFFSNEAPGAFGPEHIDDEYIKKCRWLHISGNVLAFSNRAKQAVLKAIDIAHTNGIPISLDPNMRLEIMKSEEIDNILGPVLNKSHIFLPSKGEIEFITGINNEKEGIAAILERGVNIVVRKEGDEGCTIFTKKDMLHIDAFKDIEVVDPTGCGDSFDAAFVFGYLNGWDLKHIGYFANAVGSITATKRGAMEGIESYAEVVEFIRKRHIHF